MSFIVVSYTAVIFPFTVGISVFFASIFVFFVSALGSFDNVGDIIGIAISAILSVDGSKITVCV